MKIVKHLKKYIRQDKWFNISNDKVYRKIYIMDTNSSIIFKLYALWQGIKGLFK